jgi:RimJ/RimL family protein N-acetyltransferase
MVDPQFETTLQVEALGTVRVRCLRPEDADLLYAFFETLGPQSRIWFRPHAPYTREIAEQLAARALEPDAIRFLYLVPVGQQELPAGYGFFGALQTERPVLGIGVGDAYQNKGLGQAIMAHLIAVAKALGKQGIRLTVDGDNLRAQHVYAKLGFQTVRTIYEMELTF